MLQFLRAPWSLFVFTGPMVHHRYDRYVRFTVPLLFRAKLPFPLPVSFPPFSVPFPVPALPALTHLLQFPQRGIPIEIPVVSVLSFFSRVHGRRWCSLVRSGLKSQQLNSIFLSVRKGNDKRSLPLFSQSNLILR